MNARTFDISPFHRATVGFDRLFDLVDRQFANSVNQSYPPYNIVKQNENTYQVELAVAGFRLEDLTITHDKNELIIEGTPAAIVDSGDEEPTGEYLHKGIATRSFKRSFTLADFVEVKGAKLELGILSVVLERKVPDALQPKKIAIAYKN